MSRKWMVYSLILSGVFLLGFGWAPAAFAQEADPPQDSACRSCHEDRYWLYDTGKWYCLCGKQRACSDCHGGDDSEWDVKLAHEGVVNNPIAENPSVCQDCHPEDYQAQIEKFSAVAGIDPNATPEAAPTPYTALASAGYPVSTYLQAQPMAPWRNAALGSLGLLFVGIIFMGYRCWKADCMAKTIHE